MSDSANIFERIANALFVDDAPDVTPVYEHTWPLSNGTTILLLVACAALAFFLYAREKTTIPKWRRWLMASLRTAALAMALLMMYGWMLRQHRVDLPDLALVVDLSESMAAKDVYQDESRREEVEKLLGGAQLAESTRLDLVRSALLDESLGLLETLKRQYHVKLYYVSDAAVASGGSHRESLEVAAANGQQSRLGDGLRSVLEFQRGRPTSSVVFVTDGVSTAGQSLSSAAQYARRVSMPVFTVGVGDDQAPKDVRLSDLLVEEVAFAGDLIHFDFKLASAGYEGKTVRIRLFKEGDAKVLDEKSITLGKDDATRSVRLSHREEEEGEHPFVIEADLLEKETRKDNNRLDRVVRVREETIRVLLVQEYPSFEFRFLKTMLGRRLKRESDKEKLIDLTTILQEADLEYAEQDESAQRVFPVSSDELFEYDVIIFGDVNRGLFSDSTLQLIADFVQERGGGVVFIAGPQHTPLDYRDTPIAELLPFELTTASGPHPDADLDETHEYQLTPTRMGMASPAVQIADTLPNSLRAWRTMPKQTYLLQTPDLRPGARVLLEHQSSTGPNGQPLPVVTLQFSGAGKVIFHATDESYRWARHEDGEQFYNRYWLQTIRFLSRARLLGADRGAEVRTERREYRRGEPVQLRVRFLDDRKAPPQDDGVIVVVEQEGGKRRQVRLTRASVGRGVFEATISGLVDGRYRAWMATPTLDGQPPSHEFDVTPPLGEKAKVQMDRAELTRTAKTTGGEFLTIEQASTLADRLPEGRKVRIESMPAEPIWNSNYFASVFVLLLVGEWILRKRAGML